MISLIYDLARDYQAALVGFGQVFVASGVLVALGYWLKARLHPKSNRPSPSRPRRTRFSTRTTRTSAKPRPAYFEVSTATVRDQGTSEPVPRNIPTSLAIHSQRVAAHMRLTMARADRALELHNRALIRLESADYALQRLVLDLAYLISVPEQPESTRPAMPTGTAPEHAVRLAA